MYLQRISDFSAWSDRWRQHAVFFHQRIAFCSEIDLQISGGRRRFIAIDHSLIVVVGAVWIIDHFKFSMVQQGCKADGKFLRRSGGDEYLQRISGCQIGQQPFLLMALNVSRRCGKRLCQDSIRQCIAQQRRSENFFTSIIHGQAVLKGFTVHDDRRHLSLIGFGAHSNGCNADGAVGTRIIDDFEAVGQTDAFGYYGI